MALVTISAAYGALGGEVGHKLAERLDVPFLDRAIPVEVAERLAVPLEEAETLDEAPGSLIERLLGSFIQMGGLYGATMAPLGGVPDEATFRKATEDIIRQHAASGDGVILGRAGMLVLADHPHVVRVRLGGPREARIEQAMRDHDLTREQAERQARENDGVREAWIQRFYGRDVKDPSLYDLVINATRFDADACVALIVRAVETEAGT
jgi:Cytidylate kinase-like family